MLGPLFADQSIRTNFIKTIFDIGLHEGCDAAFYLKKGFRVVGVEANPELVREAKMRFAGEIARRQLILVDKAVSRKPDKRIPFYQRRDKNGWSSIYREAAERDAEQSTVVDVETVSIGQLFEEHGIPYYLKGDIEGADAVLLEQIAGARKKPLYVSLEFDPGSDSLIDGLLKAGYSRFQLINQGHLRLFTPPNPSREGLYVSQCFHGKMSGLFGRELDPSHWVDERTIRRQWQTWQHIAAGGFTRPRRFFYKQYGKVTRKTWCIGSGWMDIHARLDSLST